MTSLQHSSLSGVSTAQQNNQWWGGRECMRSVLYEILVIYSTSSKRISHSDIFC
jgi:hypothetical protein